MAAIMKISPQGQIRLPRQVMNKLGIDTGDYVEVDVEENNIILKPRKLIDPTQGWYWTREWQETEAHVDEELDEGQLSPKFKTAGEGLKWLRE